MVVTRSGKSVTTTGKKIKFLDDGGDPSDIEVVTVSSARESSQEPEQTGAASSGSDLDEDSDEAPEEESISQLKSTALQKKREQEKLEQSLRQQDREKRKQRDLQFKQQQEAKREKIKDLVLADQLPDLLPEEAFESEDEEDMLDNTRSGKHLRTEHFEQEDAAMRKRMKLEKLRRLKEMRNQALKKGPVYVQVHEGASKSRVPRAEQSVLDTKSQWLQRESLKKK
ncbi:hypothetical protein METBIDRAFT_230387 [Metschnikowia bicuspidata var. bicuspidata NRRL YB-4993]|uniref:Uncharacterized protein n=1 Tax=Metschnikowia bicuspidata var. bicuspidata NRRL YB-4993 TaxID=869754 RepID=A0A1A0H7D9_9ASCO|nr:hypothetical protein METBIDRAFT_230387 [Metschnikowia bicuspidata var. bicuspidata NRRL YB-4993]OBA19812.1 hypothetical protein METBIDRAFT_230387 [Metschnikowia bicuspidata var. bicuspidata NRRL YB-4993]